VIEVEKLSGTTSDWLKSLDNDHECDAFLQSCPTHLQEKQISTNNPWWAAFAAAVVVYGGDCGCYIFHSVKLRAFIVLLRLMVLFSTIVERR
jgi:hypothetical protein